MLVCPNMKLIMVSNDERNPLQLNLIHVRCKQWSCAVCAIANAREWKNHVLTALAIRLRGLAWVFATITAHEETHKMGSLYTLRNLQSGWKKMRFKMRRFNGNRTFEYMRIFERHNEGKYGGYHMHMICALGDAYAQKKHAFGRVLEREWRAKKLGLKPRKRLKKEKHPARWFRDECRGAGMGFEVDFQQIGSNEYRVAGYMTKYLFKQIEILEFPKFMRRVQTSRKFGSPTTKRNKNGVLWRPKSGIFKDDLSKYERIRDLTMKHTVTEEDFEGGVFWYPKELK